MQNQKPDTVAPGMLPLLSPQSSVLSPAVSPLLSPAVSPVPLLVAGKRKKLFRQAAGWLKPADVLLDVGAGIRPQNLVPCARHICAEPCAEYADALQHAGFEVIRARATEALALTGPVDTIVALDVIEHMERAEGEVFLQAAMQRAAHQVVIFTPLGFMPQHGGDDVDPWGLQGQHWQQHRSGWLPEDFIGWRVIVDPKFHSKHNFGAFFAIWTRKP